jgi:2-oxoglutarate ferredoxin oxidoreductase subunit delta
MIQGSVIIDRERCKGCQLCVGVCPQNVLHMEQGYNSRGYHPVMLDEATTHCTGCGVCAVICPDVVFTVLREVRQPKAARTGRCTTLQVQAPAVEGALA